MICKHTIVNDLQTYYCNLFETQNCIIVIGDGPQVTQTITSNSQASLNIQLQVQYILHIHIHVTKSHGW